MTALFIDPKHVWLEIPPQSQAQAWQVSQGGSNSGCTWTTYLNQLCVDTILPWLQENHNQAIAVWPRPEFAPQFWRLVSGACLKFHGTKLALIPSDAIGQDELLVPQEWVDIPNWSADYYLAVKVNPSRQCIEIWGYTSHQRLKDEGEYDALERLYCMEHHQLQKDLEALWSIQRLDLADHTRAAVPPLAEVNSIQAESLMQRLASPNLPFPRLSLPFAQWGALLADDAWLQKLLQQCGAGQSNQVTTVTNLRQIIQGVQELTAAGWQSLDTLFGSQTLQMANSLRRGEQAATLQAKVIKLPINSTSYALRFVLQVQAEEDGRIAVRSQLYPAEGEENLPAGIRLTLLSSENEILQSTESRQTDRYIQLRRFKCPSGYEFQIEIAADGQSTTESFIA